MKKIIESRATTNPITGFTNRKSENIFIGNKILALNTTSSKKEPRLIIGNKKDLMFRTENGLYVSISDYSLLNRIFVKEDLDSSFDEEAHKLFIKTFGISTQLEEMRAPLFDKDGLYAANLETIGNYGISAKGKDVIDYIRLVERINRYNQMYIKRNFRKPEINQATVKTNIVIANHNDIDDYLERLAVDLETGQSLVDKYSRKLIK